MVVGIFWTHVDKTGDCWEWTARKDAKGYGTFGRCGKAHRFAWEAINGPIPKAEGIHRIGVLHKCDNPACVRPDHLFLGTQKDNMVDCASKGRMNNNAPCGEGNGLSKLKEREVLEIRALFGKKIKRVLAVEYGVSISAIKQILRRKTWRHLPE